MTNQIVMDPGESRLSFNAIATYAIVAIVVCLPIWYVDNFYNADGPPHLHSASLMLDIAAGSAPANGFYSFSNVLIPNSLGHWILAVFLTVFSAATASKLMASGLFCLFVASVAWLRRSVAGTAGLSLAILFAAVIGLNRMWLVGLYNFLLGAIIVIFAIGLMARWEGRLNAKRAVVLAILILLSFCSHLISLGVIGLTLGVYILAAAGKERLRSLALLALAALPTIPLFYWYQANAPKQGTMTPEWLLWNDPSISNLVLFVRSADPIFILSRRYIPFLQAESSATALASPIIWIVAAGVMLVGAAWYYGRAGVERKPSIPLMLSTAALALLVFIAPDGLGSSEGSVIRSRFFFVALAFAVALVPATISRSANTIAAVMLAAVVGYQTLGLWEYSLRYDREVAEFLPVTKTLADGERFASVMVFDEQLRFHPSPTQRIGSLAGIEKDIVAWDTYEAGYYFFPLVAKDLNEREAIRTYSSSNIIRPRSVEEKFEVAERLFSEQLAANRDKIDVLMVYGRNEVIDSLVRESFGPEPFYETANFRLFRRKQESPK